MSSGLRRRQAAIRELARLRERAAVCRYHIGACGQSRSKSSEKQRWQAELIRLYDRMSPLRAIVYGNECGEPRFSDITGLPV